MTLVTILTPLFNSWVRISIAFLMISLFVLLPTTKSALPTEQLTMILIAMGLILVATHQAQSITRDASSGFITWVQANTNRVQHYFLSHLWKNAAHFLFPLSMILVTGLSLRDLSFAQSIHVAICFGITALTTLSWNALICFLCQQSQSNLAPLLVAPLAIPSLLITQVQISLIINGDPNYYYDGMLAGLALVSVALATLATPFVLRQVELP